MMDKIKESLDKYLAWLLIIIMGIMVLNVLWQVFSRFFLETPSSMTEEFARYLLIWIGLLGAGYVYSKGMHLSLDLLTHKLQGRLKILSELITHFFVAVFTGGVLIYGGARLVYITWVLEQTSAAMQIPLAIVYLVMPLSGLILLFYALYFIGVNLRQFNENELFNADPSDIKLKR